MSHASGGGDWEQFAERVPYQTPSGGIRFIRHRLASEYIPPTVFDPDVNDRETRNRIKEFLESAGSQLIELYDHGVPVVQTVYGIGRTPDNARALIYTETNYDEGEPLATALARAESGTPEGDALRRRICRIALGKLAVIGTRVGNLNPMMRNIANIVDQGMLTPGTIDGIALVDTEPWLAVTRNMLLRARMDSLVELHGSVLVAGVGEEHGLSEVQERRRRVVLAMEQSGELVPEGVGAVMNGILDISVVQGSPVDSRTAEFMHRWLPITD